MGNNANCPWTDAYRNEIGLYVHVQQHVRTVYEQLLESAHVSVTLGTLNACVGVSSTIPCSSERFQHS